MRWWSSCSILRLRGSLGISLLLVSVANTLSKFLENLVTVPSLDLNFPLVKKRTLSPMWMMLPSRPIDPTGSGLGQDIRVSRIGAVRDDSASSNSRMAVRMLFVEIMRFSFSSVRLSIVLRLLDIEELLLIYYNVKISINKYTANEAATTVKDNVMKQELNTEITGLK